jgi:hypothetical protein
MGVLNNKAQIKGRIDKAILGSRMPFCFMDDNGLIMPVGLKFILN